MTRAELLSLIDNVIADADSVSRLDELVAACKAALEPVVTYPEDPEDNPTVSRVAGAEYCLAQVVAIQSSVAARISRGETWPDAMVDDALARARAWVA